MTDMDALDRLIASEVVRASAPPRHVDDGAIFAAITATQPPRWTVQSMFNATKLVVASAIVALIGGFGLAGVLTQRPSVLPIPAATIASPSPTATGRSAARSSSASRRRGCGAHSPGMRRRVDVASKAQPTADSGITIRRSQVYRTQSLKRRPRPG